MLTIIVVSILVNQVFVLFPGTLFFSGVVSYMINSATFVEKGQTRGSSAAAIQFSFRNCGQVFIHDFFVTNVSSILFHLAPYRCFRVLSLSRPI